MEPRGPAEWVRFDPLRVWLLCGYFATTFLSAPPRRGAGPAGRSRGSGAAVDRLVPHITIDGVDGAAGAMVTIPLAVATGYGPGDGEPGRTCDSRTEGLPRLSDAGHRPEDLT